MNIVENTTAILPISLMHHIVLVSPDNYLMHGVKSLNKITDHSFSLISSIDSIDDAIAKCQPTIIFLDYDLLEPSPLEFITAFKASNPTIKMILMKSKLGSDIELECMKNGVNFFILKPPFSMRIFTAVETVLA